MFPTTTMAAALVTAASMELEEDLSNETAREMKEEEMIDENTHAINVATAYLLLTIFTFFTLLVTVVLVMHYCERKRLGFTRELLVLPAGPVPSYMTVMSTGGGGVPQSHGHYQFHPVFTQPSGPTQNNYGSMNQDTSPCHMCDNGKPAENHHLHKQSSNKDPVGP